MRETIEDVLRGIIANQAHLSLLVIWMWGVCLAGCDVVDLVEKIMTDPREYDVAIPWMR